MSDWKSIIEEFCIDMQTKENFKSSSIFTYKRGLDSLKIHPLSSFKRKVLNNIDNAELVLQVVISLEYF